MREYKALGFRAVAAGIVSALIFLLVPAIASAETITVDSEADTVDGGDGVTTLREALAAANSDTDADAIVFAPSVEEIDLTGGQLSATEPVSIDGSPAGVQIDAQAASRVLSIALGGIVPGEQVSLTRLEMTGGSVADVGGAIHASDSDVSLSRVVVRGNTASSGAPGVITINSNVAITSSTFVENSGTTGQALGLINGTTTVSNSSFEGSQQGPAGVQAVIQVQGSNALTMENSTVFGNGRDALFVTQDATAELDSVTASGRGLFDLQASVEATNSIFSGPALGDLILLNSAEVTLTSSLLHHGTFGAAPEPGSTFITANPQLGPLQDNGGPTETVAIPATSPAYNAGATDLTTDQRGAGFARPAGASDDIGAYEQQDVTPPDISKDSNPAARSTEDDPDIQFSSTAGDLAGFECKVDAAASYSSCTSGQSFGPFTDGPHTILVRSIDGVGHRSAPISFDFTVDTTGPATSIDSAPPAKTGNASPALQFSSADGDLDGFECNLDDGGYAPCTSGDTFGPLAESPHTILVRAFDDLGNRGGAEEVTFTVDLTMPVAEINAAPPESTEQTTASFGFSSPDADVAYFECSFDESPFAECTSPIDYPDLADGEHSFSVRAVDDVDNVGAPETYVFTVDTAISAPELSYDNPQKQKGKQPKVRLTATSGESISLGVRGRINLPAGKSFRLGVKRLQLAPGEPQELTLKILRRDNPARVMRRIERGKKVVAELRVRFKDELGNRVVEEPQIKLVKAGGKKGRRAAEATASSTPAPAPAPRVEVIEPAPIPLG